MPLCAAARKDTQAFLIVTSRTVKILPLTDIIWVAIQRSDKYTQQEDEWRDLPVLAKFIIFLWGFLKQK